MQLRFASFAVINLREDLHLRESARAGRTKKKPRPRDGAFGMQRQAASSSSCSANSVVQRSRSSSIVR